MDSLISVIVPVYNAEKFLKECIESILKQTYQNIQLILINDGSTDNSLDICNYYKNMDNRVLVIDKPNSGVSETRNLGLSVAEGDYIGFVDSDDYIEENMYEVLLKSIIKYNSEICAMTPYTINNLDKKVMKNQKTLNGQDALKYLLLLKFPTSLWAYLYSKDSIKEITLNNDIHFFEDFEFNFRVFINTKRISLCDQKLYNYRINETSANSQEINDKRMTCLNIYNLIDMTLERYNSLHMKYIVYFHAHCIISVIMSIAKSQNVKEVYYRVVQFNIRKIFKKVMFSQYVPIMYKVTLLAFVITPKLFSRFLYYIKYK